MRKLSCFLLLLAGISVPTGIPKTDANSGVDYYIRTDTEIYEETSIEYVAAGQGEGGQAVTIPTGIPGTDANANADYYILSDMDGYETASIEYQAGQAYHYVSLNKSATALYHGARIGRGVY